MKTRISKSPDNLSQSYDAQMKTIGKHRNTRQNYRKQYKKTSKTIQNDTKLQKHENGDKRSLVTNEKTIQTIAKPSKLIKQKLQKTISVGNFFLSLSFFICVPFWNVHLVMFLPKTT